MTTKFPKLFLRAFARDTKNAGLKHNRIGTCWQRNTHASILAQDKGMESTLLCNVLGHTITLYLINGKMKRMNGLATN